MKEQPTKKEMHGARMLWGFYENKRRLRLVQTWVWFNLRRLKREKELFQSQNNKKIIESQKKKMKRQVLESLLSLVLAISFREGLRVKIEKCFAFNRLQK